MMVTPLPKSAVLAFRVFFSFYVGFILDVLFTCYNRQRVHLTSFSLLMMVYLKKEKLSQTTIYQLWLAISQQRLVGTSDYYNIID